MKEGVKEGVKKEEATFDSAVPDLLGDIGTIPGVHCVLQSPVERLCVQEGCVMEEAHEQVHLGGGGGGER